MRSTKSSAEFFTRMKKKKPLLDILENFDKYTAEELDKVKQPKWIRKHLVILKKSALHTELPGYRSPYEIANVMTKMSKPPRQELHSYRVMRYVSPTTYIGKDEILENELLLEIDGDTIKAGFALIDIDKFPPNSLQFVKDIKDTAEYRQMALDDNWQRNNKGEDRIQEVLSQTKTEKNYGGLFTIRRID